MELIKVIKDVYYKFKNEDTIIVMVDNEIGEDFSIADIYVGDEEQSDKHLYDLSLEVAYELGYRLASEYM